MAVLSFVLPEGNELASGGNVYNRELVRALTALAGASHPAGRVVPSVRTLTPAEFRRQIAAGAAGTYFVDTLNLAEAEVLEGKVPGQRAILVVHHLPSLEPGMSPEDPAIVLERVTLPLFDAFVATSPLTADLLARRGFARERIMMAEPGLPPIELGPATVESPYRALLVANLIPRKGVRELLFALAARAVPDDPFTLDIVGRVDLDPAYAETVGRVITRSATLAERVRWQPAVAYDAMGVHYRSASVLLSAASMETYGMALGEARGYGVPILAIDGGYAKHQFEDGVNGRLFASVDALAEEFLRLVRDGAALQTLFESARRKATPGPSTWNRTATRLLEQL
jgi:glycosyltransferase involved in cell wall biosynthesis